MMFVHTIHLKTLTHLWYLSYLSVVQGLKSQKGCWAQVLEFAITYSALSIAGQLDWARQSLNHVRLDESSVVIDAVVVGCLKLKSLGFLFGACVFYHNANWFEISDLFSLMCHMKVYVQVQAKSDTWDQVKQAGNEDHGTSKSRVAITRKLP